MNLLSPVNLISLRNLLRIDTSCTAKLILLYRLINSSVVIVFLPILSLTISLNNSSNLIIYFSSCLIKFLDSAYSTKNLSNIVNISSLSLSDNVLINDLRLAPNNNLLYLKYLSSAFENFFIVTR